MTVPEAAELLGVTQSAVWKRSWLARFFFGT